MKTLLNNFKISYKLKSSYVYNQFIYSLQRIPLIGKYIPYSLYGAYEIKTLHILISTIKEFFKTFLYKFIYILTFIVIPLQFYNINNSNISLTIYLCLSIIGALFNTEIFEPSKDKYYLINIMKMNAKNYAISNYIYFLISTFIGHFTALVLLTDIKIHLVLLSCLTMISMKTLCISLYLIKISKDKTKINKKSLFDWIISITISGLALLIAYILPLKEIIIPTNITYAITGILILVSIFSWKKIFSFSNYQYVYKKILKEDAIFIKNTNKELNEEQNRKIISENISIDNNKEGYAYFNDIFVKRHKKILHDKAKITAVIITIVSIVAIFCALVMPETKEGLINIPLQFLPYMLLLMYFINVGNSITNVLFTNCDRSMLTYRFYRQPQMILGLFKERLKTIIKINFFPTIVLAIALCILLLVCGETNIIYYLVVFFSIISMSIFFSVHNLVIYYLLQPYSIDMEMKSKTYQIVTGSTYIICYSIYDLKIPLMYFGTTVIIFSIIYVLISLILVYRYAPKTFKLR